MRVRVRVCLCVCVWLRKKSSTCRQYICIHIYSYTYKNVHSLTYIHMYIHIPIKISIHTYTRAHINIYRGSPNHLIAHHVHSTSVKTCEPPISTTQNHSARFLLICLFSQLTTLSRAVGQFVVFLPRSNLVQYRSPEK